MEGVVVPEGDFAGASVVMVDWEEEREKVLASGARCVSFNSVWCVSVKEAGVNGVDQVWTWADRAGLAETYSW